MTGWLEPRRTAACERILDAAGELFAARGVANVGMNDIARAAGCSRATLYRYFDSREALLTAFVHREAQRMNRLIGGLTDEITDPTERLVAAMTNAIALVRGNPSLSAWFTRTPVGAEAAEDSPVVQAMSAGLLRSLGHIDAESAHHWGRWLVRAITSLLAVPGRDAEDERTMLAVLVAGLVSTASHSTAL